MIHKSRNYIVTGASTGLGLLIAQQLVKDGANLLICSRNQSEILKARDLLTLISPASKIVPVSADVSNEADLDDLVETFFHNFQTIHGLVNNAGIYGPMGPSDKTSWTEWKKSLSINLFGSVYLINKVLPHMRSQSFGSIVQLSGGGATQPMPNFSSYAASKAAIVRYIESVALEHNPSNIRINSVAPGALNTRLLDQVLSAGEELVGSSFYQKSLAQKTQGGSDPSHASRLVSFLLSDQSKNISGRLISAIWDSWDCWPVHSEAIMNSEAYTLRRVTGQSLGFEWETK